MTLTFPRRHLPALHEATARVLEKRGDAGKPEALAYDLLEELFEVCMRTGQDALVADLERALSLSIADGSALAEESPLRADLATRLGDRSAYDPGGPRSAKPRQLADCVLATLGVTVAEIPVTPSELGDDVRRNVITAIASVVDGALAPATARAAILARAREQCDPQYLDAFDRVAAKLDERLTVPRQLKLSLDSVRAVQQALADARAAVLARAANTAIDGAKSAIAVASADAAERVDLPITLRLTPRDVAVRRACEPRSLAIPDVFSRTLLDALTELVPIAWAAPIATPRPYRASEVFAVGDHIDHPKFGRGIVQTVSAQKIDVEFPAGRHTLVHARR